VTAPEYVTEISVPGVGDAGIQRLHSQMREPEPLPEPEPEPEAEAALEAAREPWGPQWPYHLSLTDIEPEPEPEAGCEPPGPVRPPGHRARRGLYLAL
jgi:hypothetical protein